MGIQRRGVYGASTPNYDQNTSSKAAKQNSQKNSENNADPLLNKGYAQKTHLEQQYTESKNALNKFKKAITECSDKDLLNWAKNPNVGFNSNNPNKSRLTLFFLRYDKAQFKLGGPKGVYQQFSQDADNPKDVAYSLVAYKRALQSDLFNQLTQKINMDNEQLEQALNQVKDNIDKPIMQSYSEFDHDDMLSDREKVDHYLQTFQQQLKEQGQPIKPASLRRTFGNTPTELKNNIARYQRYLHNIQDNQFDNQSASIDQEPPTAQPNLSNEQEASLDLQRQRSHGVQSTNLQVNGYKTNPYPTCQATTNHPKNTSYITQTLQTYHLDKAIVNDNQTALRNSETSQIDLSQENSNKIEYLDEHDNSIFTHNLDKTEQGQYHHQGTLNKINTSNIDMFINYFVQQVSEDGQSNDLSINIGSDIKNIPLNEQDTQKLFNKDEIPAQYQETLNNLTMADYMWIQGQTHGMQVSGYQPSDSVQNLYNSTLAQDYQQTEELDNSSSHFAPNY